MRTRQGTRGQRKSAFQFRSTHARKPQTRTPPRPQRSLPAAQVPAATPARTESRPLTRPDEESEGAGLEGRSGDTLLPPGALQDGFAFLPCLVWLATLQLVARNPPISCEMGGFLVVVSNAVVFEIGGYVHECG